MRDRLIMLLGGALAVLANLCLAENARTQNSPTPAVTIANPIGKVVLATGTLKVERGNAVVVQANLPTSPEQPKVGDLVYQGDVVSTGADGAVGIVFSDGSAFNISSNARMVLNEFVYDPKGKSNSSFFSLSKGAFTIIAGKVAKTGEMKVNTPVATMGIRGTTPHVQISSDGTVTFKTLVEDSKAIEKSIDGIPPRGKKQLQATTAPPPGLSITPKPRPAATTIASPTETPK
jgi:hypothetical protein